jgi:hypothetical protein
MLFIIDKLRLWVCFCTQILRSKIVHVTDREISSVSQILAYPVETEHNLQKTRNSNTVLRKFTFAYDI